MVYLEIRGVFTHPSLQARRQAAQGAGFPQGIGGLLHSYTPPRHSTHSDLGRASGAHLDTGCERGESRGAMRCGLCPQAAVTAWWLADWQLERHLCGHCTRGRQDAMTDAGWQLVADDRETVGA